jgi:hypothetical protein
MLSRRSIDMMLDLIENRVACMQVIDREDHRQLAILTQARKEILSLAQTIKREERAKPRVAVEAPIEHLPQPASAAGSVNGVRALAEAIAAA